MAFPIEPQDFFNIAQEFLGDAPNNGSGFIANALPSQSGSTRQSRIKNNRPGTDVRHIMHWFVPEQPIIQMYVNPQSVNYSYKKSITNQRTKGGFTLQYWGEDLSNLRISGTTGTSGIEGINVLYDIYRNEQLSVDPYALFLAAQKDQTSIEGLGSSIGQSVAGEFGSLIGSVAGSLLQTGSNAANVNGVKPRPSLAELAFTVELYWMGQVFRGYFNSFTVTESATELGLFNYDIDFVVTQIRGIRFNFMPWHRSPNNGPSNSNPEFGTPYSYGPLISGDGNNRPRQAPEDNILQEIADVFEDF